MSLLLTYYYSIYCYSACYAVARCDAARDEAPSYAVAYYRKIYAVG